MSEPHGGPTTILTAAATSGKPVPSQLAAWLEWVRDRAIPQSSGGTGATSLGAALVTPTGGSTARTIANILADGGQNVLAHGADPTGVASSQAAFVAAAAAGPVVYVPTGVYLLTDMLTLASTVMVGDGQRLSRIKVDSASFNMSAASIIKITGNDSGAGLIGVGIEAVQPNAPADRAALTAYPLAIDAAGVTRLYFDRVRLSGLTNGMDITGNTGGTYIGRLELGCTGDALAMDGLLDFTHIDSIHVWPFGYTTTEQLAAWYEGENVALRLGRADGLSINNLATFRAKVVLEDATDPMPILPTRFGYMQLDGDGSRLEISGGRIKIDNLYSTKTITPTATTIEVSGGETDIGLASIIGGENGKQINVTGGILRIGNGLINHRRSVITEANIGVSAGTLEIENTTLSWPPGTVRDHPAVAQSSTGVLVLRGDRVDTVAATSPVLSMATAQNGHWIEADRLTPHTFTFPASLAPGRYFGAQNFTPTLVAATAGDLSVSYVQQTGRIRIDGDSFDLFIRLACTPTFTTASGNITLGGLPFAINSTCEIIVPAFSGFSLSAGRTALALRIAGTAVSLLQSGPTANVTADNLSSGTELQILLSGRGRL